MKPAFFFNSLSNSHKLVISIPHSNDLLQNSLLQNQTTKIRRCSLGKIRKATVSSRRKVFLRSKSRAYFNVLFCKKRQLQQQCTSRFPTKSALDFVLGELYAKNTKRTQEQPLSKQGPYQMSTYLVVMQTNHKLFVLYAKNMMKNLQKFRVEKARNVCSPLILWKF